MAAVEAPSNFSGARSSFHTSAALQRSGWKERNPKIGITLEQLRMAARGEKRRLPICHAEQEKVMNALEAAKYEVSNALAETLHTMSWIFTSITETTAHFSTFFSSFVTLKEF